jgi:hypothetical protein
MVLAGNSRAWRTIPGGGVLFDRLLPSSLLRPETDVRRLRQCERLLGRFASAFPGIRYDILWESDTCNGQALLLEGARHVRLYGGLLRHKHVGIAGVAFTLAHETGHHVGGPPFHEYYPWLSSEAQADAWACQQGLALVFSPAKARHYADRGQKQLARAYQTLLD